MRRPPRWQALAFLPAFLSLVAVPVLRAQSIGAASTQVSGDTRPLSRHLWKTDIVATVFWVGEPATPTSPSNAASSWDHAWVSSFGGFDDPDPAHRASDYRPASFVPGQNPFYVALPYNDCADQFSTKDEAAKVIPWFSKAFREPGKSVCQNRWIAVRYGTKVCYAQWSDCGPFVTTDASYVFGTARPANLKNAGAGLDMAPAVRDYLGFASGEKVDWRFVEVEEVPDGPWKRYGINNHFAKDAEKNPELAVPKAATQASPFPFAPAPPAPSFRPAPANARLTGDARLEELRRQRDRWLQASSLRP